MPKDVKTVMDEMLETVSVKPEEEPAPKKEYETLVGGFRVQVQEDRNNAKVFYIQTRESTVYPISIEMHKFDPSEFKYTKEQAEQRIVEIMNDWPVRKEVNKYSAQIGSNVVAKVSRRGPAKNHLGDYWYYKGHNSFDTPILVARHDDMHAVMKHPKFDGYGFRLVKMEGFK